MPYSYNDRVRDTTTYTGSAGTVTLAGSPPAGFRSFTIAANNNTFVAVVQQDSSQWEVMEVAVNSTGTTLTRLTTVSSSTGGSVNFTAGTKDVFITMPGSRMAAKKTGSTGPLVVGAQAEDASIPTNEGQTIAIGASGGGAYSIYGAGSFRIAYYIADSNRTSIGSAVAQLRLFSNNNIQFVIDTSGSMYPINGPVLSYTPAPTEYFSSTTMTASAVKGGIIRAYPTGTMLLTIPTNLDSAFPDIVNSAYSTTNVGIDFWIINMSVGATNIVQISNGAGADPTNPFVVANASQAGAAAHFRLRRIGVNQYTCYRLN
jgi:hypothetical protein